MNKQIVAACAAVLAALNVYAEEQFPLWPEGKMPIKTLKNKPVGEETVSPKGIVKNVSVPAIEVFLPTNIRRTSMGVIICPGGAYGCLDFDREGRRTARFLNKIGVAAFLLKYRVRPYPKGAALADLQRALSFIRSRAKEWKLSKNHIGVMGYSAGGHLATRGIAMDDKRVYEPIDDVDKESFAPSYGILVYPAYLTFKGKINKDIEPALTKNTKIFLLTGLADLYRGSSVGFAAAHVAANKWPRVECHFYPEGCHGFGVSTRPHNDVYRWERLLATWLRRQGRSVKAKVDTSLDTPDYTPIEPEEDDE